jgi:hypothetical protein
MVTLLLTDSPVSILLGIMIFIVFYSGSASACRPFYTVLFHVPPIVELQRNERDIMFVLLFSALLVLVDIHWHDHLSPKIVSDL